MKSPGTPSPENAPSPVNWRQWVKLNAEVPPELAEQLDLVAGLLTPEEVEKEFTYVVQTNEKGNKTHGTDIKIEENARVLAMVELAKKKGVLTDEESRELYVELDTLLYKDKRGGGKIIRGK